MYNDMIAFIEMHKLEWNVDNILTNGKRFVDGMSKAFSQSTLATWKALTDKHNIGKSFVFFVLRQYLLSAIPTIPTTVFNLVL